MGIQIPSYRRHKARDLAIVTIRGKTHYLGRWESPESKAAYRQIVGEHLGQGPETFAEQAAGNPDVSVDEVLLAYWEHAKTFYVDRETGKPTSELDGIRIQTLCVASGEGGMASSRSFPRPP